MNNLLMLFIFVPILSLILLALNFFLAPHRPDESKISAYECGFSVISGQTRSTFQIHYYIVAMLFLIFDLEILLLFPIAVTLYQVSFFGVAITLIFFSVLTVGFVLEIGSGAISLTDFDTPNKDLKNKNNPNLFNIPTIFKKLNIFILVKNLLVSIKNNLLSLFKIVDLANKLPSGIKIANGKVSLFLLIISISSLICKFNLEFFSEFSQYRYLKCIILIIMLINLTYVQTFSIVRIINWPRISYYFYIDNNKINKDNSIKLFFIILFYSLKICSLIIISYYCINSIDNTFIVINKTYGEIIFFFHSFLSVIFAFIYFIKFNTSFEFNFNSENSVSFFIYLMKFVIALLPFYCVFNFILSIDIFSLLFPTIYCDSTGSNNYLSTLKNASQSTITQQKVDDKIKLAKLEPVLSRNSDITPALDKATLFNKIRRFGSFFFIKIINTITTEDNKKIITETKGSGDLFTLIDAMDYTPKQGKNKTIYERIN